MDYMCRPILWIPVVTVQSPCTFLIEICSSSNLIFHHFPATTGIWIIWGTTYVYVVHSNRPFRGWQARAQPVRLLLAPHTLEKSHVNEDCRQRQGGGQGRIKPSKYRDQRWREVPQEAGVTRKSRSWTAEALDAQKPARARGRGGGGGGTH